MHYFMPVHFIKMSFVLYLYLPFMFYLYLNVFLPPLVFLCDSAFHVCSSSQINFKIVSCIWLSVVGRIKHSCLLLPSTELSQSHHLCLQMLFRCLLDKQQLDQLTSRHICLPIEQRKLNAPIFFDTPQFGNVLHSLQKAPFKFGRCLNLVTEVGIRCL